MAPKSVIQLPIVVGQVGCQTIVRRGELLLLKGATIHNEGLRSNSHRHRRDARRRQLDLEWVAICLRSEGSKSLAEVGL